MTRTVNCVMLKKEAEGLDYAPYPGELGRRIYDGVSKEAWQRWLGHQTMLINEYRLTPIEPEARKFLEQEWREWIADKPRPTNPDAAFIGFCRHKFQKKGRL